MRVRSRRLFLLYIFFALFSLATASAAETSTVTITPVCPELLFSPRNRERVEPHITVNYNPRAPAASLRSAKVMTLVMAASYGPPHGRVDSLSLPMTRVANGMWQADFTTKQAFFSGYLIFFFTNERGQVDNNRTRYWDVLFCFNGEPADSAVSMQASTYEGSLLVPGIQRPPDLDRAMDILKRDLEEHPTHYGVNASLWQCQLSRGEGSPAAYRDVGEELDAYIDSHNKEPSAIHTAVQFAGDKQQKLQPGSVQHLRDVVTALPETAELLQYDNQGNIYHVPRENTPTAKRLIAGLQQQAMMMLADLDYRKIFYAQTPPREKAQDFLVVAAKYPQSMRVGEAYTSALECEIHERDVAGAEEAVQKLIQSEHPNPYAALYLAEFYIGEESNPKRALQLVDQSVAIIDRLRSHRVRVDEPTARINSIRARAHLQLKDLPAASADAEAAANAALEDPDILLLLGKIREQAGIPTAVDAYLDAASAPYQKSPEARDAYLRLFVAQKLGSESEAEQRLLARVREKSQKIAASYTPLAMTRPVPDFSFTDLAGKQFSNRSAQGKPLILVFWSTWCAPCITELPAVEEFQKKHPSASVLSVEISHKAEEVKSFLATHHLQALHVGLSPNWPKDFAVSSVPTAIVLDRFGQIQFVHVGQLADVGAILGKDLDALPNPTKAAPGVHQK